MSLQKLSKQAIVTYTLLISAILSTLFLASTTSASVKASYIAIRQSPDSSLPIKKIIPKDTHVTIVKTNGNWTDIYIDNQHGWVETSDLTSAKINHSDQAKTVIVTTDNTPFFKDQRSTDKELGKLQKNTQYLRYYEKDNWSQIVYNDSLVWVSSDALALESEQDKEVSATKDAQQTTPVLTDKTYPSETILKAKTHVSLTTAPGGGYTLETVYPGEYLTIIDEANGYYHGKSFAGIEGYVNKNAVTKIENASQRIGLNAKTLKDATIVIDPGHGGEDGGAVSKTNVLEKEVALKTANELKKQLEALGTKVIMTRESDHDVTLDNRGGLANKEKADIFISLHYDSAETGNVSGTTTYFFHYEDIRLADLVNESLTNLPLPNHGTKLSSFQILRDSNSPALLIELGYMNNNTDVTTFNTDSYRQNVAKQLINAFETYFSQAK